MSENSKRGEYWELDCGAYSTWVLAHTGKVVAFWNEKRIDDQNHHRNRTGKVRFPNRMRAKQYLKQLVAKIGTPKGCVMKFEYHLEGTIRDQNSSGSFGAVYFRNSRPVMTISCDMQDGVPVSITIG
jgi:hypothetical protein